MGWEEWDVGFAGWKGRAEQSKEQLSFSVPGFRKAFFLLLRLPGLSDPLYVTLKSKHLSLCGC